MRRFSKATTAYWCVLFASLLGAPSANAADSKHGQTPDRVLTDNVSSAQLRSAELSIASAAQQTAVERYGNLPLNFETNQGQADGQVRFLSRGSGYSFFLTQTGAVLTFSPDSRPDSSTFQMRLVGSSQNARIYGVEELPGKSNYFLGSDPRGWRTGVPTYSKVEYENAYPGISLLYYGNQRQLEYDFTISPGTDPGRIQLDIAGAPSLIVDAQGNLVLHSSSGDLELLAPKAYQLIHGRRREVSARWNLAANHVAGFRVGAYDRTQALVIDPVLMYSSFLGGSEQNGLQRIAVDSAGNAYVAGYTTSGSFPTVPSAQASSFGGGSPLRGAFVAKMDPTGSTLLYSTYLSGSAGSEEATGLAIDVSGNVYVAGNTHSSDFPTLNAFQSSCPTHTTTGTCSSAFLTKISPTGDSLVFSTYLGGSGGESARGLAVDSTGSAYVAGVTSSVDFPVTPGVAQNKCAGLCRQNAFVAKFDPTGASLVYATYLGGSGVDDSADLALDGLGNAYVAGKTTSADFLVVTPYQKSCVADATSSSGACLPTAFITKLKADGSAFSYSTYLGGGLGSKASGIAVDANGSAYVTGSTQSPDFPLVKPFQRSCSIKASGLCSEDAFVTKLSPDGKTLVYSTYLGGKGDDEASGIAVDSAGNAHIVGTTQSPDFPTKSAIQSKLNGTIDAFVARLSASGSALTFATYHGGAATESGNGIALDAKGNVYIVGETSSQDFPTQHPFQSSCTGTCSSAFVTKMSVPPPAGTPAWTILSTHTDPFVEGQTNATYTIAVTNSGTGPTDGTLVTVVDTLPAGLTATAMTGTNWSCTFSTRTCTTNGVLAAGASYSNITLTVTVADTATTGNNSVTVSGGGAASSISPNDKTTINFPLTIMKTDSGNFEQGRAGVTYTISGTNTGNTATSATVTVVDTLPTGITATAMNGTGWSCTVATVTCTSTAAIAAGAAYSITLTVSVAANAAASVTNSVTISEAGFTLTKTATDTTTVLPIPVLSVRKTHSGTFNQGNTAAWTITVGNAAAATSVTYGTVTVTDTLPNGTNGVTPYTYTLASSSGTNWVCSTSGTTAILVTCTDSVDTVKGQQNFPTLTLTVNVPTASPASVSNIATASGGGAANPASNTDPNVPVGFPLGISKTDSGNFEQGRAGVTYTISGTNTGNTASSATVTVVDTLPTGITATAMSGTGWSCTVATVTCTSTAAIAAGASYSITLTVSVAANAAASVTNSVTISETGFTLTATATDMTTVLPIPVLSISKTHTGTFTQGSTATWTIVVGNAAAATSVTYRAVTVTDTLPNGTNGVTPYTYTLASSSGTNWICTGTGTDSVSCTDSVDSVKGQQNFPTLTLTVNVPTASPTSVSNTATASGGGASNTPSSTDMNVPVVQVPHSITATGGTPQSTLVNTTFPTPLAAQVLDAASQGIPGLVITFTPTASSGGSSLLQPYMSPKTDSNGNASVPVTANSVSVQGSGTYQVAASVPGLASTAPFTLTNTDFTVSLNPKSTNVIESQMTTGTASPQFTVTPVNGYMGTVGIACLALAPNGISCAGTPITVTTNNPPPSAVTISTGLTTPVQVYQFTMTGTDQTFTTQVRQTQTFSLTVYCTLLPTTTVVSPILADQQSFTLNVSETAGGTACNWTGTPITTASGSITFPNGSTGTGTGSVTFQVASNYANAVFTPMDSISVSEYAAQPLASQPATSTFTQDYVSVSVPLFISSVNCPATTSTVHVNTGATVCFTSMVTGTSTFPSVNFATTGNGCGTGVPCSSIGAASGIYTAPPNIHGSSAVYTNGQASTSDNVQSTWNHSPLQVGTPQQQTLANAVTILNDQPVCTGAPVVTLDASNPPLSLTGPVPINVEQICTDNQNDNNVFENDLQSATLNWGDATTPVQQIFSTTTGVGMGTINFSHTYTTTATGATTLVYPLVYSLVVNPMDTSGATAMTGNSTVPAMVTITDFANDTVPFVVTANTNNSYTLPQGSQNVTFATDPCVATMNTALNITINGVVRQVDGMSAPDNFGITCSVSGSTLTVTATAESATPASRRRVSPKASSPKLAASPFTLMLGVPGLAFIGLGTSAFGSGRRRMLRIISVLGLLFVISALIFLPGCASGGFVATVTANGDNTVIYFLVLTGTDESVTPNTQQTYIVPLTVSPVE